VREGF
jgi:hypothetical protein